MFIIDGDKITLTKGDSFFATIGMKNKTTGQTYSPQEGDVIRFGVKKTTNHPTCVIEKIIPNDTLLLHLVPNDTKALPIGNYVYDIELTYADGEKDTFINKAQFILVDEVIR